MILDPKDLDELLLLKTELAVVLGQFGEESAHVRLTFQRTAEQWAAIGRAIHHYTEKEHLP